MPIGKNSIKRVKNNGYSTITSNAPDMENSTVDTEPAENSATVIANPSPEVLAMLAGKGAPTEKKRGGRKKKSAASEEKKSAKNTKKDAETTAKIDSFPKFEIGDEMPVYLL